MHSTGDSTVRRIEKKSLLLQGEARIGKVGCFFSFLGLYWKRNKPRTKTDKAAFATDYIGKNLTNYQLSVETVAREMSISTTYLRKVFVESVGMSPLKYIKTRRINLAVDILSTTDRSVNEAARECGFQDASYFCKEFKKIMGTSPLAFRNKYHITTAPIKTKHK